MLCLRWISGGAGKAFGILLLAIALDACSKASRKQVTLTYFRPGWSQSDPTPKILARQFTRETGIQLKNIPVPETTLDTLTLSRKVLAAGSSVPDVWFIDPIWSGELAEYLIDLRPSLSNELSSLEPRLLPSYTVEGKVVAIPYQVQVGVLKYRTDLLREYGYEHPPNTWDELESMATRIQTGERAKGKKNFWGYVWQGAAAEALTCNALEWQIAEGGGGIIEPDRTISVNNPATIRAWQRARHWIGWISPPSVVSYQESDSTTLFDSGGAAFGRVWREATIKRMGRSRPIHWRTALATRDTAYASMPGGPGGQGGTLGGFGLAVSRRSVHSQEAIELVRFLIRSQIQSGEVDQGASAQLRKEPTSNDLATGWGLNDYSAKTNQPTDSVVSRPSSMTGNTYEQVTRAYIAAVHSVLTRQKGAPEAAAELERKLVNITGFHIEPPIPK